MSELRVSTDWSYRGLRVVSLENRTLRLVILPEAGAKIWQITYKPLDLDLLWNNPRVLPQTQPMNSRYDDVWSGGWDELFPNDEVAVIDGEPYPDHGELWTGKWDAETFSSPEEVGVKLRFTTPISSIQVEKHIVLRRNDFRVCFHHQFTNCGRSPFPFSVEAAPRVSRVGKAPRGFPSLARSSRSFIPRHTQRRARGIRLAEGPHRRPRNRSPPRSLRQRAPALLLLQHRPQGWMVRTH